MADKPSTTVEEGGPEVLAQAEPEEQGLDIELGDIIQIQGGDLDGTVATIYGLFNDRLVLQAIGDTNQVKNIDFLSTEEYQGPDPKYGITGIALVEKASAPGFVNLIDARAGATLEAFQEGKKTGEFQIVEVNEERDRIVVMTDAGDRAKLSFRFEGVPRDLPFDVVRVKPTVLPPAEQNEGDINAQKANAPTGDVDDEDLDAEEGEEGGEDLSADIEFGESIELVVQEEVKQLGTADRLYPDIYQRSEMLAQLIRLLPEPQQRDPARLLQVRRLVERMMILRNDVVRYGKTGEPRGLKQTIVDTLGDLMKKPNVPLSRKVAAMQKVLYLDHHWVDSQLDGPEGELLHEDGTSMELYARYQEDFIKQAEVLIKSFELDHGEALVGPMPKHYLDMEMYRGTMQKPYLITPGDQAVQQDEEVFRSIVPDGEQQLTVLGKPQPPHEINKYIGEIGVFIPPARTTTAKFSITRLLKPRVGRFLNGERERVIEPGEAPNYENVLVFPLTTLRDLGPIRSGSLAQDVGLGMQRPRLMEDILEELPIEEQPSADSILNLGVKGNILGNVTIKDWLAGLKLIMDGGGDAYTLLHGYGLSDIEFSAEQMQVIQEKVEQRLASLKLFMKEQRETNAAQLANLKFEPNPILQDADAAALLSRLEAEPELLKVLEDVREYMGDLAGVDANWFSQVFLKYPDFTIAILGQQAEIVGRETQRFMREKTLVALYNGFRGANLAKHAGKPPQPNKCIHVEELAKVRKAGQKYGDEPGDVTRMRLLIKFFNKFRGQIKDDWVWCNVCKEHLICGHEFLQLQEFLRPREQEQLHKELLIKYSGGAFSGKFICKTCGQGISDLDFDTSIEFDDEGRPMMGRSEMVDSDGMQQEEIEGLLSGPAEVVEELNFSTPERNFYYKVLKRIAELVGVSPEEADYRKMTSQVNEYIATIPPREIYARLTQGKKVEDFDIYLNKRIIAAAGAYLLLNIQTHIPDYVIYYTNPECRKGLFGYPLEQGNENFSGIECMISTLISVNDREPPWNLSGLQSIADITKRSESFTRLFRALLDEFILPPKVQHALTKKREYQKETIGYIGSDKKDVIAKTFRPIPYIVEPEEAAAEAVVAASASEKQKATAWIRTAHGLARGAAALNPDSKYTETTCCLNPIHEPLKFWTDKELPALDPKELGSPPFRSKTLTTTFYTEKPMLVEGELNPAEYYKLFMRVCYRGPNKGLPHELGLGDRPMCSLCGLQFYQNPSLVLVEDIQEGGTKVKLSEMKAKFDADLKAGIEQQGVEINEQTFLELLTTSQQKNFISTEELPAIPRAENTFTRLADGLAPIDGWRESLQQIQANMAELGSAPTQQQVATASETLLAVIAEKEASIKSRLKDAAFKILTSFTRRTPRECGEAVLAYLVVPFQRWCAGWNSTVYILDSYELSTQTVTDILGKGLAGHLQTIGSGQGRRPTGLIRQKVEEYIKVMSYFCKEVFPNLRPITTPGGKLMVIYLLRAYIMGPLQTLINPHVVPFGEGEGAEGAEGADVAPDFDTLYKAVRQALTKYATGSSVPSEEEIRIMLEQRVEAEKKKFLDRLDVMTKERRQVELIKKKLGLGEWAVGGTKAIRQYDDERYEDERQERIAAGLTDWDMGRIGQEGRAIDMFGYVDEGINERDAGYDNAQENDDD